VGSQSWLGYVDINQAPPGAALAAGLYTANGNIIFTSTDDPRIKCSCTTDAQDITIGGYALVANPCEMWKLHPPATPAQPGEEIYQA
jgi:hypothetical protein